MALRSRARIWYSAITENSANDPQKNSYALWQELQCYSLSQGQIRAIHCFYPFTLVLDQD